MATIERFPHIVKVGTAKHTITEPDIYTAIADIVGIKKALDTDTSDDFQTVGNLKKAGKLITLTCKTKDKKSHKIQCTTEKVSSATGSLRGKTLAGSTITTVTISRRRSRR
jgi:hypothetical protein